MMAQGEAVGVLHFRVESHKRQPGAIEEGGDPSQDHLRATMAEHIALALTSLNLRESLRNQAIRDPHGSVQSALHGGDASARAFPGRAQRGPAGSDHV